MTEIKALEELRGIAKQMDEAAARQSEHGFSPWAIKIANALNHLEDEIRTKTEYEGLEPSSNLLEPDSRDKLLEDANALAIDYWDRRRTWGNANTLKKDVIALLDRQAAITEREHQGLTISDDESLINWHGENYLLQSRVLNAERERDEFSLKLKHEMELNRDNRNALDLERISELQAKVDELERKLEAAERAYRMASHERDEFREKLSRALDLAHEIERLAD